MKNKKLPIIIGAGVAALLLIIAVIVAVILIVKYNANKINYDEYRFVEVYEFDGDVTLSRDNKDSKVYEGMRFIPNDTCKTEEDSEVELLVDDDKHILAKEDTKFKISAKGSSRKGSVTIKLVSGEGLFTIDEKLEEKDSFEVKTGNATMSVRGTKFLVKYDKKKDVTYVEVYKGTVWATSEFGTFVLEEGDSATIYDDDYDSTVYPEWIDGEDYSEYGGDNDSVRKEEASDEVTVEEQPVSAENWKEAYTDLVSDTKRMFTAYNWDLQSGTEDFYYVLIDAYKTGEDGVPELMLVAHGDFGGNGRYAPNYWVTYSDSEGLTLLATDGIEISESFYMVDGSPAYFSYENGSGDWRYKGFSVNEGSVAYGDVILNGGYKNFSNAENLLKESHDVVDCPYLNSTDEAIEAINNY